MRGIIRCTVRFVESGCISVSYRSHVIAKSQLVIKVRVGSFEADRSTFDIATESGRQYLEGSGIAFSCNVKESIDACAQKSVKDKSFRGR